MYNRTNASDSIDSYQVVVLLVEEQTDKVVMGGKFSRGDGGKPSDAKGGINWAASNWPAILALLWCLLLLNVPLKLKHVTNIQNLPLMSFCQTSSVFSDPLDLLDHPLLLDIFFLGAPQLRAGVGFLFFYKVSFEKHPSGHL